MRELAGHGLFIGESGAAPLAALRQDGVDLGTATRVLLVATEGLTGRPPG